MVPHALHANTPKGMWPRPGQPPARHEGGSPPRARPLPRRRRPCVGHYQRCHTCHDSYVIRGQDGDKVLLGVEPPRPGDACLRGRCTGRASRRLWFAPASPAVPLHEERRLSLSLSPHWSLWPASPLLVSDHHPETWAPLSSASALPSVMSLWASVVLGYFST